jgi:hypothetical protein
MTEKVKRAAWLSWLTMPMVLFIGMGVLSLGAAMLGGLVAYAAWLMGFRLWAGAIVAVAGMPFGITVAIASMYWTDERKEQLRKAGL